MSALLKMLRIILFLSLFCFLVDFERVMCLVTLFQCFLCHRDYQGVLLDSSIDLTLVKHYRIAINVKCAYWYCNFMVEQDALISSGVRRNCGDQLCKRSCCQVVREIVDCCFNLNQEKWYRIEKTAPVAKSALLNVPFSIDCYVIPTLSPRDLVDCLRRSLTLTQVKCLGTNTSLKFENTQYYIRVIGDADRIRVKIVVKRKGGDRCPQTYFASFASLLSLVFWTDYTYRSSLSLKDFFILPDI